LEGLAGECFALAGAAFAAAFLAAASLAAAAPAGLSNELPGLVVDATGASQFSESNVSFVADAAVFSGAGTILSCWRVTTHSSRSSWSPTVVDTTTDDPAPLRAPLASEYFCPTTPGVEDADASPVADIAAAKKAGTTIKRRRARVGARAPPRR
jgi:hypothetical protein